MTHRQRRIPSRSYRRTSRTFSRTKTNFVSTGKRRSKRSGANFFTGGLDGRAARGAGYCGGRRRAVSGLTPAAALTSPARRMPSRRATVRSPARAHRRRNSRVPARRCAASCGIRNRWGSGGSNVSGRGRGTISGAIDRAGRYRLTCATARAGRRAISASGGDGRVRGVSYCIPTTRVAPRRGRYTIRKLRSTSCRVRFISGPATR